MLREIYKDSSWFIESKEMGKFAVWQTFSRSKLQNETIQWFATGGPFFGPCFSSPKRSKLIDRWMKLCRKVWQHIFSSFELNRESRHSRIVPDRCHGLRCCRETLRKASKVGQNTCRRHQCLFSIELSIRWSKRGSQLTNWEVSSLHTLKRSKVRFPSQPSPQPGEKHDVQETGTCLSRGIDLWGSLKIKGFLGGAKWRFRITILYSCAVPRMGDPQSSP